MPDETFEKEDGQVSKAADANESSSAEAATPEEEPVGSHRKENRPIRKMSAADFRVKQQPKAEPKPEPKPEPVQHATPPKHEHHEEPRAEPIPSSVPEERRPVEVETKEVPVWAAPKQEPRYEEPVYEYEEPKEPEESYEEPRSTTKGASGGIMKALRGIMSFFTIIPINVVDEEIQAMNKNMYLIPFAGFVIGILATFVGMLFYELRAIEMIPIAVLGAIYILSRFLHFDGLADFGDGMLAGRDQETAVKALKDTRIGAGGLGIVLVVVLATFIGLAGFSGLYLAFMLAMVIVIMEVFAKNAIIAAAAFGEPGNGMASEQVRNTNMQTLMMSTIVSALLAFVGYLLLGLIESNIYVSGMWTTVPMVTAGLLIVGGILSSFVVGWLVAYLANNKFGFVNGDCLGAANEISRVMFLFIGLIILGFYTMPELFSI